MVAEYIWQPMASNTYNNRCVCRTRIFIAAWFDFLALTVSKYFQYKPIILQSYRLSLIYIRRIGLFSNIEVFKETKNNFYMGTQKCITGMFRKVKFLSSDLLGLSNPLSIANKKTVHRFIFDLPEHSWYLTFLFLVNVNILIQPYLPWRQGGGVNLYEGQIKGTLLCKVCFVNRLCISFSHGNLV